MELIEKLKIDLMTAVSSIDVKVENTRTLINFLQKRLSSCDKDAKASQTMLVLAALMHPDVWNLHKENTITLLAESDLMKKSCERLKDEVVYWEKTRAEFIKANIAKMETRRNILENLGNQIDAKEGDNRDKDECIELSQVLQNYIIWAKDFLKKYEGEPACDTNGNENNL